MNMGRLIIGFSVGMAAIVGGFASAKAGERCVGACYQKVVTPPSFATVAEQVVVRPGYAVARQTPATFSTVHEHVTIRPEHTVQRHIAPEYATVAETVQVSPGGKVWQVTRDHHGREVGCWVTVKPTFATRHKTVMVKPGGVVYDRVPAVTAVRARQVMVTPPSVYHEQVPAVTAVRHRTVMTAPATASWQPLGYGRRHHAY